MKICSVKDCFKKGHYRYKYKRILCIMHLKRLNKHGNVDYQYYGAPLRWLKEHKDYSKEECLIWPFCKNDKGYGILTRKGKSVYAARLMCRWINGSPPKDKPHALHSCKNASRGCCNPNHLRWGTHKENMQDKLKDGTHNRGTRNGNTHLTEDQVRRIRELCSKKNLPQRVIAQSFRISRRTVSSIHTRTWWAWLPD